MLVAAAAFTGLSYFNAHCEKKFGFKFLTKPLFVLTVAGVLLLIFGNEWRLDSIKTGGDMLNGIVLMILGGGLLAFLFYLNITKTNVLYGVSGSALQILVFGVLGYMGLFLLIIVAFLYFLLLSYAKPVWVINR